MITSVRARIAESARLVRQEGTRGLAQRLLRRAYRKSGAAGLDFTLLDVDVADSTMAGWAVPAARPADGAPLRVGWISSPPAPGSGGHTTLFRMAQALVDAGHSCTVYLYDRYGGQLDRHAEVLHESWPWLQVDIQDARAGLGTADVYIATSWETAHVLGVRGEVPGRRMYFIQDFEPWFYGHGSEFALAEDTYRFGFTPIAVGRMLAELLRDDYGLDSAVVNFGCDTATYNLTNRADRDGVVFYAKPGVSRRGFKLGVLALERFHRLHPDQTIHLFGDPVGPLPFPFTHHGTIRPQQLAQLYNRCVAGLALSFSANISLVPVEMLACGVVPVVNDSRYARADLDSDAAMWAQPSPDALAKALSAIVSAADRSAQAAAAAASVAGISWDDGKNTLVAAVEREAYGQR